MRLVQWDGQEEHSLKPWLYDGVSEKGLHIYSESSGGPPDPDPGGGDPDPGGDTPLLGVYLGNHHENPDTVYRDNLGVWPDVSSQYYQAQGQAGGTINVAAENTKLSRGIIPLITVTAANGPWTHAQIASGAADAWINYWADSLESLNPGEIWFTFDHEFEVKLNQFKFAWTPTLGDYIGAFNRFKTIVKAARPDLKFIYWYGYADQAKINTIGSGLDSPDIIGFDPYVFAHHNPSTTFEQMVQPKLDWLHSRSWYGGQDIILAEFAKDTVFGDASVADFLTNLRPKMASLGLHGAVYFSRDKPPNDIMANVISNNNWPLSKAALSLSALET